MIEVSIEKTNKYINELLSRIIDDIKNKIKDNRDLSVLVLLFVVGLFVFSFLMNTVHLRPESDIQSQKTFLNIYMHYIEIWMRDGYWKHGGLFYIDAGSVLNPSQNSFHYRSSGIWLVSSLLIEKMNYLITGTVSYKLMAVHNQIIIMITSVLFGFLVWRLGRRMNSVDHYAVLLASVSCLAVYQTFPQNLFYFWNITPQANFMLIVVVFFIIIESLYSEKRIPRIAKIALPAIVAFMVFSEYAASLFLGISFILASIVAGISFKKIKQIIGYILISYILLMIFINFQFLIAKINYPNIDIVGSSAMFRMGFDGNVTHVKDHFDLLFGRHLSHIYPTGGSAGNPEFLVWKWMFIAGVLSLIFILFKQLKKIDFNFIILFSLVGMYSLYAFIFMNAVIIHTDIYDIFLFLPLVLAFFGLMPLYANKILKNNIISSIVFIIAVCYVFVQLRSYAIMIPKF